MAEEASFDRAPLIEIVAELKWLPKDYTPKPGEAIALADIDPFIFSFGRCPEVKEFTKMERRIPSGIPTPLHHVAWRFRDPENDSVLLQVGAGIFSANALQPYKHWSEFRPTVKAGITALLASRPDNEKDQPFSGVSLRYINAFTDELLGKRTPSELMREVLKFDVEAPKALTALYEEDGSEVSTTVNLLIPIANTVKKIKVQVGEGTASSNSALMLDMTVTENDPVDPTLENVMKALDDSRGIIHQTFFDMTADIHEDMKLVKEASHERHSC